MLFHFSNSSETIAENYHVFLETSGKFTGNYSRRISLMVGETAHQAQMMVYPLAEDFYLFLLDELDISVCRDEDLTAPRPRKDVFLPLRIQLGKHIVKQQDRILAGVRRKQLALGKL